MLTWTNPALQEGLACYRAEKFFEAHEHWESVWLQAEEPEKTFLQALIQVASGFCHFQRGNRTGANSMLRKSLLKLERYPEAYGGVAVERLRTDLRSWLLALETELVEAPAYPNIELL